MAKATTTEDLTAKIVKMRNSGSKWAEISEALGVRTGKAMSLFAGATGDPITFKNEDDLAKKVVALRTGKEPLSWGVLSARTGVGEGKLRKLFEQGGGGDASGHRIGKGGRFPSGAERPAPAPKAEKAAKATKATKQSGAAAAQTAAKAKADAPQDPKKPLADYSLAELKDRLNGTRITIAKEGGGETKIMVSTIKKLKDGEMTFADKDGATKTVLLTQVLRASKPPVAA